MIDASDTRARLPVLVAARCLVRPRAGRIAAGIACCFALATGGAAAEPLVVAIPAPLTGPRAAIGLSIHATATAIAADIASGRTPGVPLRLRLIDDGCSANAPAPTDATVVVGHACRVAASAAAPVYAKAGQLFIAAGAGVPRRVSALRLPTRTDQGEALGRTIADKAGQAGATKVAVIRDKTELNRTLAARIETVLQRRGVGVVTEVFNGGDKVFTAAADRLAAAGIRHVALLAFPVEAAFAASDLAKAIPDVDILAPDHLAQREFASLARDVASRVAVMLPPSLEGYAARHPAVGRLRDRLQAAGITPTREAIETAAALEAVASAARTATEPGAASLALALRTPHETILGPLAFDADGDALVPYWTVHRWRDGALVPSP